MPESNYVKCECEKWSSLLDQKQIKTILGDPFFFCPWCGKSLKQGVCTHGDCIKGECDRWNGMLCLDDIEDIGKDEVLKGR